MHLTQHELFLFAGILALIAIALAIYTANQRKGK